MTLEPGTIVGPPDFHDPDRRIRFGVVLAPEPSERVRRIIDDDPAIWRARGRGSCPGGA